MATTIRQLVTQSLRVLGVVQAGQAPSDNDITVGVEALNQIIDSWSAERLSIFSVSPTYVNFVAGQKNYTLGAGGDWDVPRSMRIENASVVLPGGSTGYTPGTP
jgi:hypothetical protein